MRLEVSVKKTLRRIALVDTISTNFFVYLDIVQLGAERIPSCRELTLTSE